MQKIILTFPH